MFGPQEGFRSEPGAPDAQTRDAADGSDSRGAVAAAAPSAYRLRRSCGSLSACCALLVISLVLAGSLSPFSFQLETARANAGLGLGAIGWARSDLHDVLTNIAVYVPVGLVLSLWLLRKLRGVWAILLSTALGGTISLLAETLQTGIPLRTASWVDVFLNVEGTFCGALGAPLASAMGGFFAARLRTVIARKPMSTMGAVLALGLFVLGLTPFDFVSSTEGLHRSLAASRWLPTLMGDGSAPGFGAERADLSAIGVAAAFAALGFFLALGERERGQARRSCLDLALVHATIIACVIEAMQFFVVSRSFDTVDVLFNAAGAALGAYLAIYAVDAPSRSRWLGRPGVIFGPPLITVVLLLQIAYHLACASWQLKLWGVQQSGATVVWIPFSAYYGRPLPAVLGHMLTVGASAAVLAFTVASLAHRLGRRSGWWLTGLAALAAVAVAAFREAVQVFSTVHTVDITNPLLALGAAFLVAVLWRQLEPRTAMAASEKRGLTASQSQKL